MFVSRAVTESRAFLALKTAAACRVFLIFLGKCRWEKAQIRPGCRDKAWVCTNRNEIQFTYVEAQDKYGISATRFTRAIDELVRVGLIDIAHSGFGLYRDVTLYGISERWKKYGMDGFEHAERPRRGVQLGFRKGNRRGCNCGREKKSTVADARCSTVANARCVSAGSS